MSIALFANLQLLSSQDGRSVCYTEFDKSSWYPVWGDYKLFCGEKRIEEFFPHSLCDQQGYNMIDKSSSSFIISKSKRQLIVSALDVIMINVIFVVLGNVVYVHYSTSTHSDSKSDSKCDSKSDSMCGGGRTDLLRKIELQGEEITHLRAEIKEVISL